MPVILLGVDADGAFGVRLLSALRRTLERRETLVAGLCLLGIAGYGIRVWMLGRYAAPSSADHGLYIAAARAYLGNDVTGFGSAYPPIFLLPLIVLLPFVNPVTAARIVTPTAALILPFPFYRIVSRYAAKPWAFLGTGLFVFNEGYSEMTGWGGGPDLMATAFMLASLAFYLAYLDSPNRRDLVLAGFFAGLVVGTHQLTALVLACTLLTWMMLEILRARAMSVARPFLGLAAWSAVFSLPFAPYYLSFGGTIATQVSPVWPNGFESMPSSLAFLFHASSFLWIVIAILAFFGAFRLMRRRREGFLFLSFVAVDVCLGIAVLQDNPARPLYYLYFPLLAAYPAFYTWTSRAVHADLPPRTRSAVSTMIVTFAVVSSAVMVSQSLGRMSTAVDWYHAINQPELDAMDWIRGHTPQNAVVATAGVPFFQMPEGTRYAWWIEGYGQRRSFYGGSPIYAALGAERTMVEDANLYFAGDYGEQQAGLRMVEDAPSAFANPAVSVMSPEGFETAFFMNDAVTNVEYGATGVPSANRTWVPYYQVPVVDPFWTGSLQEVLQVARGDSNVSFVRRESLNGTGVTVSLEVGPANGTVRSLDFPIWAGWEMRLYGVTVEGPAVTGILRDSSGNEIPFDILLSSPASATLTVNATNADPTFGQPAILARALAGPNQTSMTVHVSLTFPSVGTGPVQKWDAYSIGAAYGVDFIFQSRYVAEMFYRFDQDKEHFRLVYQNEDIVIYTVVVV